MKLEKHIELGMKHLDVKKKRASRCPICGSLNFSIDDIIDDWMLKPSRGFDLSNGDRRFLFRELLRLYNVPSNICSIETHHISYVMDITMPLCVDCHRKAHHSDKEPWSKYKPIDKRDDPKMYETLILSED